MFPLGFHRVDPWKTINFWATMTWTPRGPLWALGARALSKCHVGPFPAQKTNSLATLQYTPTKNHGNPTPIWAVFKTLGWMVISPTKGWYNPNHQPINTAHLKIDLAIQHREIRQNNHVQSNKGLRSPAISNPYATHCAFSHLSVYIPVVKKYTWSIWGKHLNNRMIRRDPWWDDFFNKTSN